MTKLQAEMVARAQTEWRAVRGYAGYYEVSSCGQVRSLDRTCTDGHVYRGRLLKQRPNVKGYLRVALSFGCKTVSRSVHSLVLEAFVGKRPDGHETRHLNGIKSDNRLENLQWGTRLENAVDKRIHGVIAEGETHYRAKVSATDVEAILSLSKDGKSRADLSRQFGLSKSAIGHILRGRTWTCLKPRPHISQEQR